ncbi:MAG: mycofactocin precursor MftA [Geodermatophilaceae bacterium]|nr:mycofactocin precursor [Geodermatophilaceae bacterium]
MSSPVSDETAVLVTDEHEESDELVSESLVEEVSIDGMCGVY